MERIFKRTKTFPQISWPCLTAHVFYGGWDSCTLIRIDNSKLAVSLLTLIFTGILFVKRDEYLQREQVLMAQRESLVGEIAQLRDDIEPGLIAMTQGYAKYALDSEIQSPTLPYIPAPLMPPMQLPSNEMEETKWKIRKCQGPVLDKLAKSYDKFKSIGKKIRLYTTNPQILIDWQEIETAVKLIPGEDRFISSLFREKERLQNKQDATMVGWNNLINPSIQIRQTEFAELYPMPFRVYFYQDFIRRKLHDVQELIVEEQVSRRSIFSWLSDSAHRNSGQLSELEIINRLQAHLSSFRADYVRDREDLIKRIVDKSSNTHLRR